MFLVISVCYFIRLDLLSFTSSFEHLILLKPIKYRFLVLESGGLHYSKQGRVWLGLFLGCNPTLLDRETLFPSTKGQAPEGLIWKKNKILAIKSAPYTLINGSLYKLRQDGIVHWCALEHERQTILAGSHSGASRGHFQIETTIKKILQSNLWWPTLNRDCKAYLMECDKFQRLGQPLKKHEMPFMSINPSLTFEVWSIDFVGSFPKLGHRTWARYIIIVVECVTEWG